jgi:CheY-like chemotaxis protein
MAADNGQRTILVTDDDAGIRDVLRMILADEGYRALPASNGTEALALATSEQVDLILLDVVMPLFDAADFCRAYRDAGGHAPVILVSASNPDEIARAVEACGAADHIRKPFEIDTVLIAVARFVRP